MEPEHETVHTVADYYDGPRAGIADFQGRPHAYKALWDDNEDDWSQTVLLRPIDDEAFRMTMEDWEIFLRWRRAIDAGQTTIETHPALPPERERHDTIEAFLEPKLEIDPARAIRVRGIFNIRPGGQWTVQWLPPTKDAS